MDLKAEVVLEFSQSGHQRPPSPCYLPTVDIDKQFINTLYMLIVTHNIIQLDREERLVLYAKESVSIVGYRVHIDYTSSLNKCSRCQTNSYWVAIYCVYHCKLLKGAL